MYYTDTAIIGPIAVFPYIVNLLNPGVFFAVLMVERFDQLILASFVHPCHRRYGPFSVIALPHFTLGSVVTHDIA